MSKVMDKVNSGFGKVAGFFAKYRYLVIALMIVLDVVAYYGASKIEIDVSNENMYLENDPVMVAKRGFEKTFGNSEYIAVYVKADDVFAPEMLTMMRDLGKELKQNVPFVDKVMSVTDFNITQGTEDGFNVAPIVPEVIPTDKAEIEKIRAMAFSKTFLKNKIFSDDSKEAWIILRMANYPKYDSKKKGGELTDFPQFMAGKKAMEVVSQNKYKKYHLKATGFPVTNYQKRLWYGHESYRTAALTVAIVAMILFLLLRTLAGVFIPLVTASSAILWVFSYYGFIGERLDNTVMTIPMFLGLVISIGYSTHMMNFFSTNFRHTGNRLKSIIHCMEHSGWPTLFAALTTIAGCFANFFVHVKPVQWISSSMVLTIIAVYIGVTLTTPAFLSFGKDKAMPDGKTDSDDEKNSHSTADKIMLRIARYVREHVVFISVLCVLLYAFTIYGLTKLEVDMDVKKSQGLKIPFVADYYNTAHTKVGSMYAYDVTIKFKNEGEAKKAENLAKIDKLAKEALKFPLVKRSFSLAEIVKDLNQVMNENKPEFSKIPDSTDRDEMVAQLLLLYEMQGGKDVTDWIDYKYKTLRLNVEIEDYSSILVGKQFDYFEKRVKEEFPDAEFGMVGSAVQFAQMNNYVTIGQIKALLIAFIAVSIMMIIAFGSFKIGIVSMIPNILPALFAGGLMGFLGTPLDYATMVIGPMVLGLAVDNTIHIINGYKMGLWKTGDHIHSFDDTLRIVGKGSFMASLMLILGFTSYLTSDSLIFFHMGFYTILAIFLALIADLFVTPSLILILKPFSNMRKK